jgi:hypothetical protein
VATLEARGHADLEARAATSYEHWVGSEGLSFRGRDDAERLGDVVKVHGEAVDKDGEAFGVGLNFIVLATHGRIERCIRRSTRSARPAASSRRLRPHDDG